MTEKNRDEVLQLQRQYIDRIEACDKAYTVEHRGKSLQIAPGVFPPYLDSYLVIDAMRIEADLSVLDCCSGSGIIALFASERARSVVATDINPLSVSCIEGNARLWGVRDKLTAMEADVFPPMESGPFDVITINPPYTDHPAATLAERSVWDEGHEMVRRFFAGLKGFLCENGTVYLGWADFADIEFVKQLCMQHHYRQRIAARRSDGLSEFVVFEITR